ncbi:MAG: hypothetical protein M0005_17195 [Actinomycetota bacterium]|jgi:N-acetylmuramic acid 6-phosphate etherase|nr:hypothetical protein [Actinomycetota bacterium]
MDNTGIYQVPTEAPNPRTRDIDLLPSDEVVSLLNSEDQQVPLAVAKVLPELAHAVELVVHRLRSGGKVHYFRAGRHHGHREGHGRGRARHPVGLLRRLV